MLSVNLYPRAKAPTCTPFGIVLRKSHAISSYGHRKCLKSPNLQQLMYAKMLKGEYPLDGATLIVESLRSATSFLRGVQTMQKGIFVCFNVYKL